MRHRKYFPLLHPNYDSYPDLSNSGLNATHADDMLQNSMTHVGDQYIGFRVHTEEFLLSVLPVREIIMLPHITYAPRSDEGIEGIIALRGEIMPVLNLRRFFGFARGEAGSTTRVVILHTDLGGFGIIIDAITEFVWLQESDIESIPQNFFAPGYKVLNGVAKVGERVRGIVDISKFVTILAPPSANQDEASNAGAGHEAH